LYTVVFRYSDYFANMVFAIFVQLAFKYRQNSIHCTSLSSHSAKHQQSSAHYCWYATYRPKYTCIGQIKCCTPSVCLSGA